MLQENAWHVNCQDPPDEDGICDNWWVDSTTGDSYALFKLDDMEHNFYGLMHTMFSKTWISGKDLFASASECSAITIGVSFVQPKDSSNLTIGLLFPYTNPATLESFCYSNLRVCPWNLSNDLTVQDDNEFEQASGCTFAWPNFCISSHGLRLDSYDESTYPCLDGCVNLSNGNHIARELLNQSSPDDISLYYQCLNQCKDMPDVHLENIKSGAGIAQVQLQSSQSVPGHESTLFLEPTIDLPPTIPGVLVQYIPEVDNKKLQSRNILLGIQQYIRRCQCSFRGIGGKVQYHKLSTVQRLGIDTI